MIVNNGEQGVILGGVRPRMPKITVYPAAQVDVHEGGLSVGDATHHLRITLPMNGEEICIPYNPRSLNALAQIASRAAGIPKVSEHDQG